MFVELDFCHWDAIGEVVSMEIGSPGTRREYVARINRVIDYLRENLDRNPTLKELADVAAFSPFHFHRIFKAMMGESINEYVNRLRLQKAANLLRNNPNDSITEISFRCGFSSSSNFARAFRRHYGCTAGEFRTGDIRKMGEPIRNIGMSNRKYGEDGPSQMGYNLDEGSMTQNHLRRYQDMKVEVKNLPPYRVAYVRVIEGYGTGKIKPAFDKVIKWAGARDLMGPDTLILGIGLDDPRVTPTDKCRYDACVTVPPNTKGEGDVGVYDIPGGKYAIYRFEGQYAKIHEEMGRAWNDLMGGWFPDSGYQPDHRPCFEIYRESEEELKAGKFVVDICEPVKPL